MSIENAIADHAAAIRELAAAIAGAAKLSAVLAQDGGAPLKTTAGVPVAEQEKVMAEVAADRKPTTAKEAIDDALAKARADKEKASAPAATPAPAEEPAPTPASVEEPEADTNLLGGEDEPAKVLTWKEDLLPVLQKVGKNKDQLAALLSEFDVGKGRTYATGNLLPPETFPTLLAAANKLLGK